MISDIIKKNILDSFQKGKKAEPVGTIKDWKGKKFQKQASGKWTEVVEKKGGGKPEEGGKDKVKLGAPGTQKTKSIEQIPEKEKEKVVSLIDKLAEATKEAKAKGEKAPNFNLCKVSIPGTNLFCGKHLGIPRAEMPQFKGNAVPGSQADKLPKTSSGEVDVEHLFHQMLIEHGINVSNKTIGSEYLKSTQSELVGSKVASMAKALDENPNNPGITAPIYVSKDGYILDGHHRWAAMTAHALEQGKSAKMNVIVVDKPGVELVKLANRFADQMGIEQKAATPTDGKK